MNIKEKLISNNKKEFELIESIDKKASGQIQRFDIVYEILLLKNLIKKNAVLINELKSKVVVTEVSSEGWENLQGGI